MARDVAGLLVICAAVVCSLLTLLAFFWFFAALAHGISSSGEAVFGQVWVLLCVLLASLPALWLAACEGSAHLRLAAAFALCNWMLTLSHAFGTVTNESTFFSTREKHFASYAVLVTVSGALWLLACPFTGFLLSMVRLQALEQASMRSLGFRMVMRLAWALITGACAAGVLFVVSVFWAVPLAYTAFLVLAGLLFPCAWFILLLFCWRVLSAQRLVAAAAACAPSGKAATARRAAAALRFELLCMAVAFMSTGLAIGWTVARTAAGLSEGDGAWLESYLYRGMSMVDLLCNGYYALSLSGALSGAAQGAGAQRRKARRREVLRAEAKRKAEMAEGWRDKVEELAGRGVTLEVLLKFYAELPERMAGFDPSQHTTADVVRRALIPLSEKGKCAAAEVLMEGRRTTPNRMVTHAWSNVFRDLMAAVLADALGEGEFGAYAQLLDGDMQLLEEWVSKAGVGGRAYWICAFSVNQHLGICGGNHKRKDSVSGELCPECHCGLEKAWNDTKPLLPDGRSVPCEMNKFDDMMRFLSRTDPNFSQVFAVDAAFDTFTRAWCVAELAVASEVGMEQFVKIRRLEDLTVHQDELHGLRIQDMKASRQEDKDAILASIEDHDAFNVFVQKLLFEELLPAWSSLDASERMASAGRLLRWEVTAAWASEMTENDADV